MVDVSAEVLEKAKKELYKLSKVWAQSGGVCKGTPMDLEGNTFGYAHTACHSWVSTAYGSMCFPSGCSTFSWAKYSYTEKSRNFLILSCHNRDRAKTICSPEASDFLVLWMAKESPFSKYILNRGDNDSLTTGGVVILCGPDGASIGECMWICKVLRFITEGSKAADTFMTLVKGGADPMLAVYVASLIRTIKGATFGYTGTEVHSTVFAGGNTDVVGLLTRNVDKRADNTSSVFVAPEEAKIKFGKLGSAQTKVKSFCKPYKKDDGWGGAITGEGATGEELVARVLEWQKEIGFDGVPPPYEVAALPESRLPNAETVYLDLDL